MKFNDFLFLDYAEFRLLSGLEKVNKENNLSNKWKDMIAEIKDEKTNESDKNGQLLLNSFDQHITQLEEIIAYQALVIQSLLSKLDEAKITSKAELRKTMEEIDELDGVKDSKLNINTLLHLLQKE